MLMGPNNSGKTAVINALSLLPHPECPMPNGASVSSGVARFRALVNLRGVSRDT